jgi:hypothetical protein
MRDLLRGAVALAVLLAVIGVIVAGYQAIRDRRTLCDLIDDIHSRLPEAEQSSLEMEFDEAAGACE